MSSYTRELVEQLCPAIHDPLYAWGMTNEYEADLDMPRTKPSKAETHTLWAHLADIRIAWDRAELTRAERQGVVLIGGMGMTTVEAGKVLGITKQSAQERYDKGVGKLMHYLNGTSAEPTLDDLLAAA